MLLQGDENSSQPVNVFVGEDDDESQLAERFVEKYSLPPEFKVSLDVLCYICYSAC